MTLIKCTEKWKRSGRKSKEGEKKKDGGEEERGREGGLEDE